MSELPVGWANSSLGDVSNVIRGITFPASAKELQKAQSNVCCLRTSNIQKEIDWDDVYFVSNEYVKRDEQLVRIGDILMSMANSYDLVGKVAVVRKLPFTAAYGAFLAAIRPTEIIDGQYLFHLLRTNAVQLELRKGSSQTTNIANISASTLADIEIPLAPLAEQKRIADKLDALLARVDATRERLDRIPTLLKRFRQSVLAAATSGRLTEDWRTENPSAASVGPVHHRSDTEQPPPKGQVEFTPAAWAICKVKDAGKVQLGRQRSPKFHSGENMRPYLRVQNVFEDRIDLSDVMEMVFSGADFERYQLHYGDILLNEGQSPELLGRPAMYRGELPGACFTNTLIRFQAYSHVKPDYALIVFRNHMHSGRYRAEGNITTNIAHLGAGRFAEVEFPLPPLEEQTEIVRRVEALFALADKVEARYTTARAQVTKLTPALLAKAFRGELVEQDPNDEPAEQLLARLRVNIDTTHRARRGRKSHQDREQA